MTLFILDCDQRVGNPNQGKYLVTSRLVAAGQNRHVIGEEVVPVFVEFEVAVPHLRPAGW
jgi:hypothetical protein